MATFNIPLTTLSANQVVNIPSTSIGSTTDVVLALNRNVGTASLDTTTTASIALEVDYSTDGGTTFNFLMSATVPGGVIFADKAQTIRVEVSSIEITFPPSTTHIKGGVTNGSAAVSVSGSLTTS